MLVCMYFYFLFLGSVWVVCLFIPLDGSLDVVCLNCPPLPIRGRQVFGVDVLGISVVDLCFLESASVSWGRDIYICISRNFFNRVWHKKSPIRAVETWDLRVYSFYIDTSWSQQKYVDKLM